jgi:KipI family sensor histidine kinase inhibitor
VVDASLTEEWLAAYFADGAAPRVDEDIVASLGEIEDEASRPRSFDIAVRYDGEDLAEVARACNLSVERVRELHAGAEYTVLFLGFMPGFAYLGGLPRELEVPRLPSPRVRVPRNAVAVAGRYAGIYPFESPGGWRLLGTAVGDAALFGPEGALLRAGDHVRFVA